MRAAFPQRLAAQGCPRDARIFIDNVEDLFGHEGANRVLKGCDGVRPDRVSTDAVNGLFAFKGVGGGGIPRSGGGSVGGSFGG